MATLEDIAGVPGFGGKAAGELKAFLEARSGELLDKAAHDPGGAADALPPGTPEAP
jgi:hypothetical protein